MIESLMLVIFFQHAIFNSFLLFCTAFLCILHLSSVVTFFKIKMGKEPKQSPAHQPEIEVFEFIGLFISGA